MKTLLLALALVPFLGYSQLVETGADVQFEPRSSDIQAVQSNSKSTSCGPDTVLYTLQKATGLQAISINNATSAQGVSQYYNCPQPLTITGVEFYAYKIDATGGITQNVTVQIYTAGTDSMPSGLPLVTSTVLVDTNFGGGNLDILSKFANMPAITVTQPYVVVVSNNSPNGVGMIFSDYAAVPADGGQEWLCSLDLFGTWTRSYGVNVGGTIFDSDALFYPLVSYTMDSDFTPSADCFSGGPTINFTNNSSPILQDRMYNLAAFLNLTPLSYTWDFGDGGGGNAIDTANTYANTTLGYTVYLTDTLFGWTSTCVDVDSTFIGDDLNTQWSSVPAGAGVVNFTDNSTSSAAITNWLWDFGDGNTSTQQNPSHTYAATGTYTVCLTAVTVCGADSSCATVNVTICNNPTAAFSETNNDPSFDFTDGSSTTGVVTYSWDFGDGNTSTQQNPSNTYIDNGTYTVTLIITDDCGVDTVTTSVTVNNGCVDPVAGFTQSGSEPTFAFTNTSTSSTNTTYSWDMGDGTTYTTMDVNHTYSANNTYTITLIVTDDCGADTTTQTVTVSTIGLLDLEGETFVAYPNPANDVLNIQSAQNIIRVELMDMTGRMVVSNEYNTKEVEVKTSQLAEGQYTLRAIQEDGAVKITSIEVIH
ncbi:PKD domain-containing protein [Crocinitomicaceae bacterium]|nr:PKD domain-containing protein [Crocinitomicaceae bacterium]MDC0257241.1 PKD domain-containing protein [Crocinitomicaceae bacterium]